MMHLIRALEDKVNELKRLVDSLRPNGGRLSDIERDMKDLQRQHRDLEGAHNILVRQVADLSQKVDGEFVPDHLLAKLLAAVQAVEALAA